MRRIAFKIPRGLLRIVKAAAQPLQILPHDVAGRDTRLQRVQRMVETYLGARHEEILAHDVFGAKEFSRLAYIVGEKFLVGEIKKLVSFTFRWIDVSVKFLRETH